jgi:hypothetical protein
MVAAAVLVARLSVTRVLLGQQVVVAVARCLPELMEA